MFWKYTILVALTSITLQRDYFEPPKNYFEEEYPQEMRRDWEKKQHQAQIKAEGKGGFSTFSRMKKAYATAKSSGKNEAAVRYSQQDKLNELKKADAIESKRKEWNDYDNRAKASSQGG